MKNCSRILRSSTVLLAFLSMSTHSVTAQQLSKNPNYDEALAKRLDADQYGMKQYVMAFLKSGPHRDQDSATAVNLQRAHLKNIMRMAKEGTLALAGPFLDGGDVQGIYLFNVKTVEEARKLTETDPAIKAGRLVMELHPWYGSAALMEVTRIHGMIGKKNIAD